MRPPFCPHLGCKLHEKKPHGTHWYRRHGCYPTKTFGMVQRFKCKNCGGIFSSQTFSIDYYAKKIVNYHELVKKLVSTSSIRDMARDFGVSTDTVMNKLMRCSRQAIALQEELKQEVNTPAAVVADGFESYCVSQYFPNNIHLLALKDSQFIYYLNYVTIRRKGRMTLSQKLKRQAFERRFPAPQQGVMLSFDELLDEIVDIVNKKASKNTLHLYTDEKRDYAYALSGHRQALGLLHNEKLFHIRISSRKSRTYKNPLFSVNYLDREIRKNLANHVRETVCFSRNVNNCVERLMIYSMHHNYIKVFREKKRKKDVRTHAEIAGIDKVLIRKKMKHIFTRRRFLSLERIQGFNLRLWLRQLFTPLKTKVEYIPRYLIA